MYLDKLKLKHIMETEAEGSYNKFARILGVDVSQLHKILNSESNAGPKFLGKLMVFCENRKLNFIELFTPEPKNERQAVEQK
jgi:hypothetical protein